MQILVLKSAQKELQMLDSTTRERIRSAICNLPAGDVKSLTGYKGLYRLRVGNYRTIFQMDAEKIIVRAILPRGQVYKRI